MRRNGRIHEHTGWPDCTIRCDVLAPLLASVRHRHGRLLLRMGCLGFDLQREASLTTDVVTSSVIEGETSNPDELRSSIAARL